MLQKEGLLWGISNNEDATVNHVQRAEIQYLDGICCNRPRCHCHTPQLDTSWLLRPMSERWGTCTETENLQWIYKVFPWVHAITKWVTSSCSHHREQYCANRSFSVPSSSQPSALHHLTALNQSIWGHLQGKQSVKHLTANLVYFWLLVHTFLIKPNFEMP